MKIAQVTSTFPPYMAGTGNVCYHNSLELVKLGHEVTVFTTRFPNVDWDYPGSLRVERFRPIFRMGNMYVTPQLLKLRDFDIIHLHYPCYFGGEMIYLVSKLRGEKYVITYHNDAIHPGVLGWALKLHRATLMRKIIDNARRIYVSSIDFAKNSFCKYLFAEKANRVIEIPIGVDSNLFNPNVSGDKIKEKHGIEGNPLVLFAGALDKAHYFKGIEYLLKAFTKIKNEAKLLIVGDGDLKNYYMELSKELEIVDRTIFVGGVLNKEMPEYYAACDLMVLPSIGIESFGIVLIEAMACGKPVIASNLPGVRTVVDHEVNGFLVEPSNVDELASRIQYLLDNHDIRRRFGESGRKKIVRSYDWGIVGRELEKAYVEALS
jgi:glycosyltransferase involved in cell wall biosynthesis